MTTEQAWDRFARYYDDYTRGFRDDLGLYTREAKPREQVLEVGCGTGRVLQALLERGHQCIGLDLSGVMLEHARIHLKRWLNGQGLQLARHDLTFSPYHSSASLGILAWYTFNYIADHPERFLTHLRDSLFLHHRLLIDCFYPRSLYQPETDATWTSSTINHNGHSLAYRDKRSFARGIESRTQIFLAPHGEDTVETRRRYYSPAEMRSLLRGAGYAEVEFCAGYGGDWTDELDERRLSSNFMVLARR